LKDTKDKDVVIEEATYCYVSVQGCWKDDFDYHTDSFESFSSKYKLGRKLFAGIFKRKEKKDVIITRKMNYDIK
jgi:hypothetical protein